MGTLSASPIVPSMLKPSFSEQQLCFFPHRRRPCKKKQPISPVARLFGPAIFEASKLKVLFLGVDENKHPGKLPRTYTLTHSDITSKLTLAISQTINNSQKTEENKGSYIPAFETDFFNIEFEDLKLQGWYNRLQRDEVLAEWKKVKGKMSLHVHCHISGGHFLLDICAWLRNFIFCKELPVVLKAFVHGDGGLFSNYPELQEALVWVYFHSNIPKFNKVECWGPLKDPSAPKRSSPSGSPEEQDPGLATRPSNTDMDLPQPCDEDCDCCFPPMALSSIKWSQELPLPNKELYSGTQQQT